MMEIMPNKLVKAREIFFSQGDEPDGVYYICSGKVEVSRSILNKNTVIGQMEEGDVFGELAMIDNRQRAATVIAVEDTWVYHFKPEQFEKKLKSLDPFLYSIFISLVLMVRNMNIREDTMQQPGGDG